MQLYIEWANKNRASPITKAVMPEMLQIKKADERRTGVDFPLDQPYDSRTEKYNKNFKLRLCDGTARRETSGIN